MNNFTSRNWPLTALVLGLLIAPAAYADEVQIADGDTAALLAALEAAGQSGEPTTISLAQGGAYVLPAETIHLGGATSIDANGAVLESVYPPVEGDDETGTLFVVDAGSTVKIQGVELSGEFHGRPWLKVLGHLVLQRAAIHGQLSLGSITLFGSNWSGSGYLIMAEGTSSQMNMRNVTIDMATTQPANDAFVTQASFLFSMVNVRDGATATMQHVTLRTNQEFVGAANNNIGVYGLSTGNPDTFQEPISHVLVSNSAISVHASGAEGAEAAVAGAACVTIDDSTILSNGGNVLRGGGCDFDETVANIAFGSFGDHGGPVPTLSLRGWSPAVNTGADAYCLPTDARGYLRGAECDAGAFELGAAIAGGSLGDKGAGGYWNAPDEDLFGFLAVSFPDTEMALLVWSTFDASGHSTTVYGTGSFVDEDTIEVPQALIDLPVAGSNPVRSEPEVWGSLRLDLESCTDAHFSYQTSQPGFASGEKDIGRLSVFSSVGCSELAN